MAKKISFEEFLERAKKAHPKENYFYYEHSFDGMSKKMLIKCMKHGDFCQVPTDHVRGQGCPKCGVIKSAQTRSSNTEEFKEKYKKIFGDRYDLSLFDYYRCEEKGIVICKKHGKFRSTPRMLLRGEGCPTCYREALENRKKTKV